MEIRNAETAITPGRVIVRESDLLEAVIVALESGEFRQICDGRMFDQDGGYCVWGVATVVMNRAGVDWLNTGARGPIAPAFHDAAARLGYGAIEHANDAGVPFAAIAQALREARQWEQ